MSEPNIPYFDLTGQFSRWEAKWFEEIRKLGKSGNFILGNAINELESELASYLEVLHTVTVSSGTDALTLALRAVGVKPGDSVLVPDFTFFATVEAVSLIGAAPKFVDIERSGFNMDPRNLEQEIDESTKAILPVHLFGLPARLEEICEIGDRTGIPVIEDAAQSFGAKFGNCYTGSQGQAGCFSFYPTKVLGAFGDGGMIATNDPSIAKKLRLLRNHGMTGPNEHDLIGCTSRLNTVQAVLLKLKLRDLQNDVNRRSEIAARYMDQLRDLAIELPEARSGTTHVYNIFTIRTPARDELARALSQRKIGYQIYYQMPLHKQHPYADSGYVDEQFPESVRAAAEVISLPLYPEIPDSHVDRICRVIREVLA